MKRPRLVLPPPPLQNHRCPVPPPPKVSADRINSSIQREIRRVTKRHNYVSGQIKKSKHDLETGKESEEQENIDELCMLETYGLKLGVKTCVKKLDEIRDQRKKLRREYYHRNRMTPEVYHRAHNTLNRRFLAIEGRQWARFTRQMQAQIFEAYVWPPTWPLVDLKTELELPECLMPLHRGSNPPNKIRRRPRRWHADVVQYYLGRACPLGAKHGFRYWCHVTRSWGLREDVKPTLIVPLFRDLASMSELLFGTQCENLESGHNALLLSGGIASWFTSHKLVVIPVDASTKQKQPIQQWRVDILDPDISSQTYTAFPDRRYGRDIDGQELQFLGEKRPSARFLYFHFLMALVRAKDLHKPGWQETWARYHEEKPFAAPEPYMWQMMMGALAMYFETPAASVRLVESWVADHGFDAPLAIEEDELREASRRVYEAVEAGVMKDEDGNSSGDECDSEWDENVEDYEGPWDPWQGLNR